MDELEQQEQEQKGQGDVQEEELVRFQFRKVCGHVGGVFCSYSKEYSSSVGEFNGF